MADNPTKEEVLASIVPRSDQLNSEDCVVTGPITVTVAGVRRGSKEQPIIIDLEGRDRPYKPCKTVRRLLIAIWSDDPKRWVGQSITIYADPDVVYAGVRVGGLRVSHATGIDKPKTLMLTKTRGKKAEVTVQPLQVQTPLTPEEKEYVAVAREELAATESMEELKSCGEILKGKPKAIQDALRPVFAKRQRELKDQTQEEK